MGRANPALIFTCFLFASLFVVINAIHAQTHFTYKEKTANGPHNWGKLNPKWKLCETGKFQSPIDLHDKDALNFPAMGRLNRTYKTAPAVLRNRVHDIQVAWTKHAGGVIINGTEYKLLQAHWHTPSEHTMDGKQFDMEMHMVHRTSQGKLAVISILYKLGRPDPFLAKLLKGIESLEQEDVKVGKINPWGIKFGSRNYFRYMGSLTVPPCAEGVLWTVLKTVRTVSAEQIKVLKSAVNHEYEENPRPTQSLNGRSVYLYRPHSRI